MSIQITRRILVVDDEERVRLAVQRVLTEAGYEVYLAADGAEGLAMVEKHGPDLVLVDLMMPVMDGMEFLDQARRRYPDLTSVVITGFATLEKAVEAMKQGADDFLAKPFKPQDLRMVVERAFRRADTLQNISIEKSRTRALVAAMRNGVLVVDAGGEIALVNPVLAKLLGKSQEELQGRSCGEALPWPAVCQCLEQALQPIPRELTSDDCRGQVSLGQGDDATYFQVTCAPFYDARRRPMGAVAVFDDITAWRRLDQYKSEFVSTVAHEIVSPLSAVLGQLQNLNKGLLGPLEEPQKELLGRARERLESIAKLSRDLLDLSKIEAGGMGQVSRVQLAPLFQEAVDQLMGRAQAKSQSLELEIDDNLPEVMGVGEELLRVATNLVSNAVKYTPQGGRIRVRAAGGDGEAVLSVQDNGLGIPPEEQEAIFQRFHRVKNADTRQIPGTGLGLAIVKRVVESHDGRLELTSEPGKGSTFTLYLPAAPQ
ncbi:ATP-binding protein [Desulfoferula mesophila]|uniref:histidine kinase n=1 Tax=Desulfoferula mesophila TaxID=3058419 RepID=A0AAU9F1N6_9BACT|nr:hybrid sensor histidine kinase/response regulator [Desulfoferula mesophilus]